MYTREVFPKKEFKDKASEFVLVHIDVDKDTKTPAKYGVSGIPDIQFMTPDGEVVHRVTGFEGLDGLLSAMEEAKRSR